MKRLIALLCVLLMLSSAGAEEFFTTKEGIQFGMTQEEVIATIRHDQYTLDRRETGGGFVFDTLEVAAFNVNGLKARMCYSFLTDHLVAIQVIYEDAKAEEVKEILTAKYSKEVIVPLEKLGNGVYAIDDEGQLSETTNFWLSGTVLIVFEGEEMKVTLINLAADWLKAEGAEGAGSAGAAEGSNE